MRFDFSFDKRVADRYSAQRAHAPEVSRQIGTAVAAAVGAPARVLEIGIGTGRIARPVAQAGCNVFGFDLSAEMLTEAYARLSNEAIHLLQADMHSVPLLANSMDGVLAVHVLHLAKDWQQVLREAGRVLRPGGVFIQGDDWIDPESVVGRLRDELRSLALALYPNARPPAAGVSKRQLLTELGGDEPYEVVAAEWTTQVSPQERLDQVANRMDAESWFLPDPVFEQLLGQLRAFAAKTWSNLEEPQPVTRRFILKITRGNW